MEKDRKSQDLKFTTSSAKHGGGNMTVWSPNMSLMSYYWFASGWDLCSLLSASLGNFFCFYLCEALQDAMLRQIL